MGFGSSKVTNVLLLIIAFLLLAQVMSSSPKRPSSPHSDLSQMGDAPMPTQMNPHGSDQDPDMGADQGGGPASAMQQGAGGPNFNFQNMVYSALRCPSDATTTLSDERCKGKEADARRKFVDSLDSGLPPRLMFDKIIEKFGEKALSDEALEIRKNNRRQ